VESVAPEGRSLWKLYGWWVLASTVGWAAGPILLLLSMGRRLDLPGAVIGLVALGAIVGLAQWLVLRLAIPAAGWWVLATAGGIAAGVALTWAFLWLVARLLGPNGLLGLVLSGTAPSLVIAVAGAVVGILVGAAAGMGQSKALPWRITDVGWWVLASTLGGALDGALVGNLLWALGGAGLVQSTLHPSTPLFAAVGMGLLAALVGPLKGIATGIALLWLVKKRPL
jgi:hypothetical protein